MAVVLQQIIAVENCNYALESKRFGSSSWRTAEKERKTKLSFELREKGVSMQPGAGYF